jgi:hypothetical protein
MFFPNLVLKERMGSLPFHEYALELLFKAPTLPQNARKHTLLVHTIESQWPIFHLCEISMVFKG